MSANGAKRGSTFRLSHQRLQRPQADLYVFRVEGELLQGASRYCPRRCETRLSVIEETLGVSFGGSLGLSEGGWCWEEGPDDRPGDPGEVATKAVLSRKAQLI